MPISTFENYLNNTREARVQGYDEIKNLVQRQSYLAGDMLDNPTNKTVRGGDPLKWTLFTRTSGNFGSYEAGEERAIERRTGSPEAKAPWRFFENNEPIVEAEIDLNEGDEEAHYNRLEQQIFASLDTEHYEGIEKQLFAIPNTDMIDLNVRKGDIISIPTWVPAGSNESTYQGLPANWGSTQTIANINRVNNANARPVLKTYSSSAPGDKKAGLWAAFGKIFSRTLFDKAVRGLSRAAFRESVLRRYKIVTGLNGRDLAEQEQRFANDQNGKDSDFSGVTFRGLPIDGYSVIDELALDHSTATPFTQPYPSFRQPFWFLDLNELYLAFHPKHMMNEVIKDGGARQRDLKAVFRESWMQMICERPNRLGCAVGV